MYYEGGGTKGTGFLSAFSGMEGRFFLFLWKRLNGKRNIRFRKEND